MRSVFNRQLEHMHAWNGICWLEAEHIKIGHIMRRPDEISFKLCGILEPEELSARELGEGVRSFNTETVMNGEKRHCDQTQWRNQHTNAIEYLL